MPKTWRNNFEWEGGGRSVLYLTDLWPVWSKKGRFFNGSVSTFLQLAIGFFNQDIVIGCLQVILVPKVLLLLNLELNYREQVISKFKKKNCLRLHAVRKRRHWKKSLFLRELEKTVDISQMLPIVSPQNDYWGMSVEIPWHFDHLNVGSASDWSKICLIQSEALPRAG